MILRLAIVSLAVAAACLATAPARAVTIDWVTVGNAGNANDMTGYGAVGYEYKIGKYEITIQQYTDFLNAVAATDPYSLYFWEMGQDLNVAGISRIGTSGGYTYSVINNGGNSGNRPITYVSWFDAARFANWMHNGQGSGSTETGAYTLNGAVSGTAPAKNPGATFYIPTENEWYKAAYYSPVKGGMGSPGYYSYATQSDAVPGNMIGSEANQANYRSTVSGTAVYAVTQSSSFDYYTRNYLTDVGAFTNSASYYGAFDMSGNVWEWNDLAGAADSVVGLRGGFWSNSGSSYLSSSGGLKEWPSAQGPGVGFRLASPAGSLSAVPEIDPAGMGSVLALVGGALGLMERRRRRV